MATVKKQPLGITEVVLRDAHQSILATRLRIEDMLPICEKLDKIGYGLLSPGAARPLMPVSAIWARIPGKDCAC